jgi:citrate lyase subunit beta / citryl-CoA lyase
MKEIGEGIGGVDARTWRLVPGDRPDQFSTPEIREADALVLDLANNVAPENVELARRAVAKHLSGGGNTWVRVNGSDTDLCSGDLRAVVAGPGLRGVVLARTESADQIGAVKRSCARV